MNRKIPLGITISLVAIGCAITFVLTWTISLRIYNSKIVSGETYAGVYKKLSEMDTTLRANYIGEIDDEHLESAIISGYVSGIGDKYASYMPANSFYELQQTTNGVVNGAGFEAENNGSGYLKVIKVYPNSSAESNGVKAGDIITQIDGRSLLSMTPAAAQERLSGEIGTTLALKLVRGTEEFSVTLIRQQIDIESVTDELLDNNIGYIRITTFNGKTAEQFSTSLNSLLARNIKALIIDLRHNGGGVVSALTPMLNRLIPATVVATAEYSGGLSKTLIETDSEESLNIPTAILVDGGTASAAELFAVALRDHQGALLIGTQTYGKAVMQNIYEMSDGSAFSFSVATIIPAKSEPYNGIGLKPDFTVELPADTSLEYLTRESDTQLRKAIEILSPEIAEKE